MLKIKFLPLIIIWLLGLFLRTFDQSSRLGFYYDQGRDAQIAADILAGINFPAIGPTTGMSNIYLGPFWYYLITPAYWISRGHPAMAAAFLSLLESLTIIAIFLITKKYAGSKAAFVSALIWAFSYYLIRSSRWFSNPTPLPLLVILINYFLLKFIETTQTKYFICLSVLLGLSLQLEFASAVFFIPVIAIYLLIYLKIFTKKFFFQFLISIFFFLLLLVPQLLFDIKNNFIITRGFFNLFSGQSFNYSGSSFAIPGWEFFSGRSINYYQYFFNKLDPNLTSISLLFLTSFIFCLFILFKKYRTNNFFVLQLLWLLVPLILLYFFSGNYGRLYDYYLTGFYTAFVILFSLTLTSIFSPKINLLMSLFFIIYFLISNFRPLFHYLTDGIDGPANVVLGNELAAVDDICSRLYILPGTVSVFVPPVVPYAYDYLFRWRQNQNRCPKFDVGISDNNYLIYEKEEPPPERFINWYRSFGPNPLKYRHNYGGVVVENIRTKN